MADPAEWKALEKRMGFTNGSLKQTATEWNVQSFGFGADGAAAFAEAMRFNPALQQLCLFNSKLGDAERSAGSSRSSPRRCG